MAKRLYGWIMGLVLVSVVSLPVHAQNPNPALEKVLSQMDATAANFRTAQADFVWDQFQQVVNDHDYQKGRVYFRRSGKETQMLADISEHNDQPIQKTLLYSEGKVQVYEPKVERVTVYPAGKNRSEVETFLVLGFGGSGRDLVKTFDVKYLGTEKIDGVDTAKLELVPKSKRVRGMFNRFVLWIDPQRGVSLQQQAFEPATGDYRLTKYSNIQLNQKLPENTFRLKTTSKTQFVTPQG